MLKKYWPLFLLIFFGLLVFQIGSDIVQSTKKEIVEIPFESSNWQVKEGRNFPYREQMLNDLVTSKILKGIPKSQVIELLGKPTRTDKNYMFYLVNQKRAGFFPLHTRTLVLKLFEDDTVDAVLIHE